MPEKTDNQLLEEILFELKETRKYKKNASTNTGIIAIILVVGLAASAVAVLKMISES